MTKIEANTLILQLIARGFTSSKAITTESGLKATDVDNGLRRLKSEGSALYDKDAKAWTLTEEGKLKASAPAAEGVEGSDGEGADGTTNTEGNESTTMSTENSTATNVDDIDAKIAAARSAKDAGSPAPGGDKQRARLTPEERAARDKQRDEDRAKRKSEREASRAAKKAEREASKKPAHMSKVDKAASKLPTLGDDAKLAYNDLTANLSRDQVSALALHLQHFNRLQATDAALGQKLAEGQKVRITGGDARFIGQVGTVSKAQRIRCYVEVPGVKKPVYLFTSDVEVVAEEPAQQAAQA